MKLLDLKKVQFTKVNLNWNAININIYLILWKLIRNYWLKVITFCNALKWVIYYIVACHHWLQFVDIHYACHMWEGKWFTWAAQGHAKSGCLKLILQQRCLGFWLGLNLLPLLAVYDPRALLIIANLKQHGGDHGQNFGIKFDLFTHAPGFRCWGNVFLPANKL